MKEEMARRRIQDTRVHMENWNLLEKKLQITRSARRVGRHTLMSVDDERRK